jgi:nucleoside-diphosphate-sugar epimerase
MRKKILVIGANSAFAKDVMPILAQKNIVITAGRKNCDIYCDVAKAVTIPSGIDVVINFAAAFGGQSDEDILNAQKTNSLGTLNVCVAAKRAGVKHIVNISSIHALLDEESPQYSIYSITKKQADELAEFYCRANKIPLTIIRPSRIYGDSDAFAENQPFFYQIMDKAQAGEDISIYGKNDALRNYIHGADLAEIINRIVANHTEGTYPCTHPFDVTYSRVARTAQKIFNQGGKTTFLKDKPDILSDNFARDLTIYEKIGYRPKINIEMGISRIKKYRDGR